MAYTAITVQTVGVGGSTPTANAIDATNGNKFVNDGKTFIRIIKGAGTAVTATVNTGYTRDGFTLSNQTVAVGTSAAKTAGPYPVTTWNVASGTDIGTVTIDWSGDTTNTTIEIFN